jgi:hypothetical protein
MKSSSLSSKSPAKPTPPDIKRRGLDYKPPFAKTSELGTQITLDIASWKLCIATAVTMTYRRRSSIA